MMGMAAEGGDYLRGCVDSWGERERSGELGGSGVELRVCPREVARTYIHVCTCTPNRHDDVITSPSYSYRYDLDLDLDFGEDILESLRRDMRIGSSETT